MPLSLQSLSHSLSSGASHNVTAKMAAFHISVPCRQPDLSVQYHSWSKVDIRGQPLLPHSMGRKQGWGNLRANPGFVVFWFISSLLSKPIFGQPPLYGGFSPVYTGARRDLSSSGVYRPKSWCLEGVRIWKLSRTYPGEKPPSFSVLTHRCSLVTRKRTRHLLTIPYILVRIGAPYKGWWPTLFHLPRNYGTIFKPKIFNYYITIWNSLVQIIIIILSSIIHSNLKCKLFNTMLVNWTL